MSVLVITGASRGIGAATARLAIAVQGDVVRLFETVAGAR
jgi:NADP-dependent 3-hydroxy acid dehydrogenase YdfG